MNRGPTTARRCQAKHRKLLPIPEWPAADQAAWGALFQEGDLLDDAGAALHWRPATRLTNLNHYGRWLGWLSREGRLAVDGLHSNPWERATPEVVEAYARSLLAEVAPRTVATSLIGLKCVLQRMAPEVDWTWLKRVTNRLDSWASSSRKPRVPEKSAPELFELALAELDRLSCLPALMVRDGLAYRDTLIVALLLACPIRLRNLAGMELSRHLAGIGTEWHLRFEPAETKTGQAMHLVLPRALTPYVATYLASARSLLSGAKVHAGVWPAQKGRPMAEETIYASVMSTSARLFGTALNPHAFRSLAATLLAEASPEDALHARPLLGHRNPQTTESHYIRASQIQAARRVTRALQEIRDAESECMGAQFRGAE